jgi:enoyl-CoA hydratase
MSDTIRVEIDSPVDRAALVTINRPDARNSLDASTLAALIAALTDLEADDGVDVVVLTGEGTTFCAGLDLTSLSTGEIDIAEHTDKGNPWPSRDKPLIAAVNGAAITGGLELVLNADIVVASDNAKFADTHTRVGILPWWGMTVRLPRAVGPRNAAYMSLTGNFISAQQALDWGLVSLVVSADELISTAGGIASDIIDNDQPGVRAMLGLYHDRDEVVEEVAWQMEWTRATQWQSEGFDSAEIARRFEAIKQRGRSQK